MSEYQYYEFLAVDRPLTKKEMDALREVSSRAEITSTRFVNEYHYGDFHGEPLKLVKKYFDAFIYAANWGSHQLMLRLPKGLINVDPMWEYGSDRQFEIHNSGTHFILNFEAGVEGPAYDDVFGENWMEVLLPLRDELLGGDLRALYLGWLACVGSDFGELADDDVEPPVPPGLGQLSPAQQHLANYLWISEGLLAVAARNSPELVEVGISDDDVEKWLVTLPVEQKDQALLRVFRNDASRLRAEWLKGYRDQLKPGGPAESAEESPRRTVLELIEAGQTCAAELEQQALAAKAKKEQKLVRQKASERARQLDQYQGREAATWQVIEAHVASTDKKRYDEAIKLLDILKGLAERAGSVGAFQEQVRLFRAQHKHKSAFLSRLTKAGLYGQK